MRSSDFRPLILVALFAAVVLFNPSRTARSQDGGARIALVVANDHYSDENDASTVAERDAAVLADELRRDNFATESKKDLGLQAMRDAIAAFLSRITPGSTALFYYNGIGIQVGHQTFLIPVNVEIWGEADVRRSGINLDTLVADMHKRGAATQIVVLDAARPNPYERRFREYSAGLAGIDAPVDTLVLYATAPNKLGKKPSGQTSVFMNEFVKELRTPGISAEEAFSHTRIGVARATSGDQVPWDASSLVHMFYFGQAPATPPAETPTPADTPPVTTPPTTTSKTPAPTPHADAPPKTRPPVSKSAEAPPIKTAKPVDAPTNQTPKPADTTTPGSTFKDCPDCPELKVLAAGSFQMGSGSTPFDKPVHHVTITKPFAIGRTEVTFASWATCVTEGGCKQQPDKAGFGGGERPVINVSWYDTREYLDWLSKKTGKTYRLPSEAEWEYAARGGTTTAFSWGAALGDNMANCADCSASHGVRQTLPVKSFAPNKFDLFDMAGNAAEWVEDCWNLTYKAAPHDGAAELTGNCQQRVLRGGSFDSTGSYVKPTARFRYDADVRYFGNGFRVLREIP